MADLAAFTDYEREFLRLTQGVPSRISHVLTYESDPGERPPAPLFLPWLLRRWAVRGPANRPRLRRWQLVPAAHTVPPHQATMPCGPHVALMNFLSLFFRGRGGGGPQAAGGGYSGQGHGESPLWNLAAEAPGFPCLAAAPCDPRRPMHGAHPF
jgi:hypothetical protein